MTCPLCNQTLGINAILRCAFVPRLSWFFETNNVEFLLAHWEDEEEFELALDNVASSGNLSHLKTLLR